MSVEEHHFDSKADAGASKTYPQQAGTIRKNGYLVIKGRPCKVVEVSTSKTGKHGHAKCHFVAIDIFNSKKLEDIVPSSHNCDVPHVNRTDYQLIDISEDGFVSLLTENGSTKDDLRLPTDDNLLSQVVEVSTSKTGKHGHAKCHFVAIDIFNSKKLENIVPSSHNCDVPHVNRTDYQLIDISEDGFVSLLTENGNTKDDLRLPTDDDLLSQIKDGFAEGKDLVVTVMSAMGEEQICALKDIGPKN